MGDCALAGRADGAPPPGVPGASPPGAAGDSTSAAGDGQLAYVRFIPPVRSESLAPRMKSPVARTKNPQPAARREGEPSRERFEELCERFDHGIALVDSRGILRWCNSVLVDFYLQADSPAAWQGKRAQDLFRLLFQGSDGWSRIRAALRRLHHSPKGRVEIADLAVTWGGRPQTYVQLVICALKPGAGRSIGWEAWYFYDVTSHRKSELNLQALLQHSTDGIFAVDSECRLRVFNEACERLTGWRAEEVLAGQGLESPLFRCAHPACSRFSDAGESGGFFCARAQESVPRGERPLVSRTGETFWVEVTYAPMYDSQGRIALVLGIMRDVTQRHQLEEQLRVTRQLATLGELASAVAHEIKNPLGIIHSSAEILINPNRPDEQKRQAAEFIRDETRRLDDRIQAFLKFSRPKPPDMKRQSIHKVLTQTIIAYQTLAREGLTIETHYEHNLPHVHIDADQMQQVFLNLIMNADQAMDSRGVIRIRTGMHGDHQIAIEVRDHGPGIREEDAEHLFELFYSTKPRGTGLGLPIVMQIVLAHGGQIEARNCPDGGASFVVTLPAAADGDEAGA